MVQEAITAMFFFLTFFGMIFGIFYFRNRENMAMIERGMNPRSIQVAPKPFISLKYGLLLCGVGLGLFLAFLLNEYMTNHGAAERVFPQIYCSLIALFGGLGLVLSYRIEKKEWLDKKTDN